MRNHRTGQILFGMSLFLASMIFVMTRGVRAVGDTPSGPDRYEIVTQEFISFEWWLTDWSDNQVVCSIIIDHEGLPTATEIYASCGADAYQEWIITKPCEQSSDVFSCTGYYLQFVKSQPDQRKVGVPLPAAVVWVSLNGCAPYNSTFRCMELPSLVLSGEEPLSGEQIINLAGNIDGEPFTCDPICQVDLVPTGQSGIKIEFWAISSYGDTSELFTAQVRVIAFDDGDDHGWYADVLSTQWRDATLAGCSQIWDAFPPVGGPPQWLSSPQRPEDLESNIPYTYLSANLIRRGLVDASICTDGGILENGLASSCGVEVSRNEVNSWQNRFDSLIFTAAQSTQIPAQLLKNIFSHESQFWPGINPGRPEAGLGQLTENGADTILLWNQPYYEQFCVTALDNAICRKGYAHLQPEQQDYLKKAVVKSVDAFCDECTLEIDIPRAENSVAVFAEALLANCGQTGMLVYNTYARPAGEAASYEDLWRFTLVNYNAGPGCLTLAIKENKRLGEPLDWEHLQTHLTPACWGAKDYVESVSQTPAQ